MFGAQILGNVIGQNQILGDNVVGEPFTSKLPIGRFGTSNGRAVFHSVMKNRRFKMGYLCNLLKNLDILAIQETHLPIPGQLKQAHLDLFDIYCPETT